jgi:regulator of nucleoside diphosphate kinase
VKLILLESDVAQIQSLIEAAKATPGNDGELIQVLQEAIETAEIRKPATMPTNIVRMNSQVYVFDLDSGEETAYTLVFPQHADIDRHRISVLAPLGAALLGRRVGQIVRPVTPNGRKRRLRVGAIVCEHVAVPAA